MPIDKLEKLRSTDVDSSSVSLSTSLQRVLCCCECGETKFTLRRVVDDDGKRITPAKLICVVCYKK